MDRLQFFALLAPALGSVVLVILSWINANARTARVEAGLDQVRGEIDKVRREIDKTGSDLRGEVDKTRSDLRGEIDKTRSDLRGEIEKTRSELRGEILQLRGDVTSLRDMVYREMVSLHERVASVEAKNS